MDSEFLRLSLELSHGCEKRNQIIACLTGVERASQRTKDDVAQLNGQVLQRTLPFVVGPSKIPVMRHRLYMKSMAAAVSNLPLDGEGQR